LKEVQRYNSKRYWVLDWLIISDCLGRLSVFPAEIINRKGHTD
jgi:hypothetical protein